METKKGSNSNKQENIFELTVMFNFHSVSKIFFNNFFDKKLECWCKLTVILILFTALDFGVIINYLFNIWCIFPYVSLLKFAIEIFSFNTWKNTKNLVNFH